MNWIIWGIADVFTRVQLVSVVGDLGNEDPDIVVICVLGDGRHRVFGHGPALRDGGAHHGDDGSFKFEKEC